MSDKIRHHSSSGQSELVVCLPSHHLGDGVPDGHPGLFNVLLGQARGYADLQGRSDGPITTLEQSVLGDRHTLEAGDENTICEGLYAKDSHYQYIVDFGQPRTTRGRNYLTSSTHSWSKRS